jgi:hypothetical protein
MGRSAATARPTSIQAAGEAPSVDADRGVRGRQSPRPLWGCRSKKLTQQSTKSL